LDCSAKIKKKTTTKKQTNKQTKTSLYFVAKLLGLTCPVRRWDVP
jgi:hypothetical protein